MALDVSTVDRSLLKRSPITNAICQIRFDSTSHASEAQVVRDVRDRLGGETAFPRLEQIVEGSINFSIGAGAGAPQQISSAGWRMTSGDESRAIALLPNAVTLEAFTYGGWDDDFAPQLDQLLSAVADLVEPVFEQRLGLRYINQVTIPEIRTPEGWRGLIADEFLGPAGNVEVGDLIVYSRQQFVLEPEEGVRLTVNHGYAPDEARDDALTYVLDFDVAREGARAFDPGAIRVTADNFNAYALRLFQLATTKELREVLNPAD